VTLAELVRQQRERKSGDAVVLQDHRRADRKPEPASMA